MEVRDLMIGDWIEFEGTKFRVDSLRSSGYVRVMAMDAEYDDVSIFSPIPLTVEILRLNGFNIEQYFDYYKKSESSMLVKHNEEDLWCAIEEDLDEKEIKFFFSTSLIQKDYCRPYPNMNFQIRYVHEFQHFIHLFGFNKLSDNFKISRSKRKINYE